MWLAAGLPFAAAVKGVLKPQTIAQFAKEIGKNPQNVSAVIAGEEARRHAHLAGYPLPQVRTSKAGSKGAHDMTEVQARYVPNRPKRKVGDRVSVVSKAILDERINGTIVEIVNPDADRDGTEYVVRRDDEVVDWYQSFELEPPLEEG
jgi:hypothetical protein